MHSPGPQHHKEQNDDFLHIFICLCVGMCVGVSLRNITLVTSLMKSCDTYAHAKAFLLSTYANALRGQGVIEGSSMGRRRVRVIKGSAMGQGVSR